MNRHYLLRPIVAATVLLALLATGTAQAVPSYARQTGMACEACHTVFPQLTHFGRVFKANGYTLDNLKPVRGVTAAREELLALTQLPPISLMVQASETWLSKPLPDITATGGAQNGSVAFPQQISIFYAGKIAPQLGAFIQITYGNDSGTIGIDNADVRYANSVVLPQDKSLIYGVSVNNNPTVQDLWNSTPAFGFPFAASNANVSSLAGTAIDGTFGQDVAGISAYAFWNESLYGELGVYRSAKQGAANPVTGAAAPLDGTTSNVVNGVAPYYRLAWEKLWGRHSLELGVYGMDIKLYPGGTPDAPVALTGPFNKFSDFAQDLQYQYLSDDHQVTLAATRINEKMHLDASYAAGASANATNDLTTLRFDGTWYWRRKLGVTAAYFSTTGSADDVLYSADPVAPGIGVVNSANNKPDTSGWVAEVNYVPWLNVKLSLQYTAYSKFNGGSSNYDGFGRSASDNNTAYALLWFAY
ncbi:MAG: hypothetical protein RL684_1704 [Pseudomonadota bacterium]